MTFEGAVRDETKGSPAGTLADEYCVSCHGNMVFKVDSKAIYYKSCLNCGYIECLHRRFLRWDRRYRRWQ